MSIFSKTQAAFARAFAEPVRYTGAGLADAEILAIKSDEPAPDFSGGGATLRTITFEIAQALLPAAPRKSDLIVEGGTNWRVTDITRRDDIGAWQLVVQK